MNKSPRGISELSATLKGSILTITRERVRRNAKDSYEVDINLISDSSTQVTDVTSKSNYYNNRLLLTKELRTKDKNTLVVYTEQGIVKFYIHSDKASHPLSRLITVKSKVGYIRLTKNGIRMVYVIAIDNTYNLPIKASYLSIGDTVKIRKDYPVYRRMPSKFRILRNIFTDYVEIPPLLDGEVPINTAIGVAIDLGEDRLAMHSLTRGNRRYIDRTKWYYAPITQTRLGDYSISIRRNANAGLSLVRRPLEDIEKTPFFRFIESRLVSFLLYHIAHIVRALSPQVVNIYFEKNANQAEEGTIDLFRKARDESSTKNYFIINKWASAYPSIEDEPGVIGNFTWKSYWLMYRANNVIATEVPQHVNVLRSGNKYVRLAPYTQRFVFLQHGITYMKAQTKNSSFLAGREGEPDYMIVSSKKERNAVSDMLKIGEERLLNTGMLIFDGLEYNHISPKSEDIVTIMLTWKPYEEHLRKFTTSTYYRSVTRLYEVVSHLVGSGNIRVVAHPKFLKHMKGTDLANSVWSGTIADALEGTKLLITDYSSVCYNVFYQGGAVLFYQPDIGAYEQANGKLIPTNDEYIGHRIFTEADMDSLLKKHINNQQIDITKLRTKQHVVNYLSINEHNDGRNITRMYDKLKELKAL